AGPICGDIASSQVGELRDNPVRLARSAKAFPAKSQVQGQAAGHFPVILGEHSVIVRRVMTVGVGLVGSRNARINRGLLKVGIIAREIRVKGVSDRAIRIQSAVTRWCYY